MGYIETEIDTELIPCDDCNVCSGERKLSFAYSRRHYEEKWNLLKHHWYSKEVPSSYKSHILQSRKLGSFSGMNRPIKENVYFAVICS
jgi:hypothetical protein